MNNIDGMKGSKTKREKEQKKSQKKGQRKGQKKGQAAIEYLMTYGWVLIVIFVVIALILATGVFSPGRFLSQECKLTPDFPCLTPAGEQLGSDYKVRLNITNGLGYNITLEEVKLTDTKTGEVIDNSGTLVDVSDLSLSPGDSTRITGIFGGNAANEMRTFYITLGYFRPTVGEMHYVSGRIRVKIEPG